MSARRTPIKHDWALRNVIYIFLADANLAMRMTMSVNQEPGWYGNKLSLFGECFEIQYAAHSGRENLIHIPKVNRTHALSLFTLDDENYHDQGRSLHLEFDAVEDCNCPPIPHEFNNLTPVEVIALSRCSAPQRLDIDWRLWNNTSSLEFRAAFVEEGTVTDAGARKRRKSPANSLDEFLSLWA